MEYVNVEYLAQYKTKVEDAGNEYTPAVNAVKNFLTCADGLKGSQDLEMLIENMNTTKQKLQQVADAIKYMAESYEVVETSGAAGASQSEWQGEDFYSNADEILAGGITLTDIGLGYGAYECFQTLNSGISLLDFNDSSAYSINFLATDSSKILSLSELNNWTLYVESFLNPDEYADDLMRKSLKQILDGMPDASGDPDQLPSEVTKLLKALSSYSGDWEKLWKVLYGDGTLAEADLYDPQLQTIKKIMDSMPKKWKKRVNVILEGLNLKGIAKFAENSNAIITFFSRAVADYSAQLEYLETIENSLLMMGYDARNTSAIVEELRKKYDSIVYDYLNGIGDVLEGEVEKKVTEELFKRIPQLKTASYIIDTAVDVSKLAFGDQMAASNSLYGLAQFDGQLTKAYATYEELIANNMATETEIQEAERLYQLLKSTKIAAYENMVVLEKFKIQNGEGSKEVLKELEGKLEQLKALGEQDDSN